LIDVGAQVLASHKFHLLKYNDGTHNHDHRNRKLCNDQALPQQHTTGTVLEKTLQHFNGLKSGKDESRVKTRQKRARQKNTKKQLPVFRQKIENMRARPAHHIIKHRCKQVRNRQRNCKRNHVEQETFC